MKQIYLSFTRQLKFQAKLPRHFAGSSAQDTVSPLEPLKRTLTSGKGKTPGAPFSLAAAKRKVLKVADEETGDSENDDAAATIDNDHMSTPGRRNPTKENNLPSRLVNVGCGSTLPTLHRRRQNPASGDRQHQQRYPPDQRHVNPGY